MLHAMRYGTLCAITAAGVAVGGCGGDGGDDKSKPAPSASDGTSDYALSTKARRPAPAATLDGTKIEGQGKDIVVVRIAVKNNRSKPLTLREMRAVIRTRAGASRKPIVADGKKGSARVFAVARLEPRKRRAALVAYRVARSEVKGSDLRFSDSANGVTLTRALY